MIRSQTTKEDFIKFLQEHPELRFWQAIYAFTEARKILVDNEDPFYWEEKKDIV